ncbi:MAG: hypothetical protein EOS40_15330 [Mesorhizobium sp.]|nr:MAG: hypothetical protein EOS40_15330 [Mesorhizobium sp.]
MARAVHRFTETPNCSNYAFLRNSGRKTVSHFSWNCSSTSYFARIGCGMAPRRRERHSACKPDAD